MTTKIATWNVNSLKVRLPHVLEWLSQHQPDILALQEIKMTNESFPHAELQAAGYQAVANGQKTYNGVAILAKAPIKEVVIDLYEDHQRRLLAATIGSIRLINLYVPNGEAISSAKYVYKLEWLAQLHKFIEQQFKLYPHIAVVGDFNIAPEPQDVYDPEAWAGQTLFSEPEREAFQRMLAIGLHDSFRLFDQADKSYSWWDYRQGAFRRNMGLRIDHILLNKSLADLCRACSIDKIPRKQERPSDHAPVMVTLEI